MHLEVTAVLNNFVNVRGKNLCWIFLFIKLQAFRPANLLKKTPTQVFSCEIWKILKNTYFEEHLQTPACVSWLPHRILIFTFHSSTRFSVLLYYAIKTKELMMHDAVSFEKIYHWMKYLAFESYRFLSLKCLMKA